MASLLLTSIAGAATSGLTGFAGSAIRFGAMAAASIGGRLIDQALFGGGSTTRHVEGPRLQTLDPMTSREGAGIAWLDGRARLGGNVIWAARLREEVITTSSTAGGGKGIGGGPSQTVTTTEYRYFASFAIGLADCTGAPVRHFGRIWADGKPLDLSGLTVRFHHGTEDQVPDPAIVALEGEAPAYRGLAYVVFEDLPIDQFGRRVPQLQFEIWGGSGEVEELIRGVDIIPGATEFGYMPDVVRQVSLDGSGDVVEESPENTHRHRDISDWSLSLDMLGGVLPNAGTAALVVGWFGTDLRAGLCAIEPRVERRAKATKPVSWSASGLTRGAANVVSTIDGRPAFGSTPADISVVRAIRDLRARGFRVVLYPFLMLDIAEGQALPAPDGTGTQGAYPWRGRIAPRAGQPVAAEVAAFMGTAAPGDFSVSGEAVSYAGPAEWSFRRFILHLAALGKAAGGIDAILIGSEMVAMTRATVPGSGEYPFVDALVALAGDVKAILPAAKVSYAADWSEYHSHRPVDGSGDLFFNLDPLWASASVDFVAIDNYLPLADWRDGTDHLDYDPARGHTTTYSLDYLKSNIEAGEYFDWFYASEADRALQNRTPISDGAYGEPWVFRNKDIRGWHGAAHHDRPAGVRAPAPTAWTPGAKPVWFTEIGCPAVDRGANRPNVFWAAHTSEAALPWFSAGTRDDFMARQFIRASLEWWRDNGAGVVDIANVLVWSWDARPWPEFPQAASVWTDGGDWRLGHWWNGRAGAAPAAESLRRRLVAGHGFPAADIETADCHGQADGYPLAEPLDFRAFAQPFEVVLDIDAAEDGARLIFRSRDAAPPVASLTPADMIDRAGAPRFTATRGAVDQVAASATLTYADGDNQYFAASARDAIEIGPERGAAEAQTPLVLDLDRASAAVTKWLRTAADGRERLAFDLPPSEHRVRPGTLFTFTPDASAAVYLVERVTSGAVRRVEAVSHAEGARAPTGGITRPAPSLVTLPGSLVALAFLDLPLMLDQEADDWRGYLAAHANPWPGGVEVRRSVEQEAGYSPNRTIGLRAGLGVTAADLPPGRPWSWSGEALEVELYTGALISRPEPDVLAGANALAIAHPGGWEIVQFAEAELIGARKWRLRRLLRGQRGTEGARAAGDLAAGARVVVLDGAVVPAAMNAGDIGRAFWWRYGPAGDDPAGENFAETQHAFRGIGRRPFAPVHLRAVPDGAGGLAVSWIRRTRIEGDPWPGATGEVPLGEASESYRVEIGPPGSPVRVLDTALPGFTYTAAEIAADGVSAPFGIRVAQVSATFGAGPACAGTVAAI